MQCARHFLFIFLTLAACDQGTSQTSPQPKATPKESAVQILERKGKFVITPTTLFCSTNGYVHPELAKMGLVFYGSLDGVMLSEAIKSLGQSDYLNGSGRWGKLDNKYCPDNGQNVIIYGTLTMNASGKPYRIELLARQLAVVVKVAIERDRRRPDSIVPEQPPTFGDGPCCEPENSIGLDARELSQHIVNIIFKGSSR